MSIQKRARQFLGSLINASENQEDDSPRPLAEPISKESPQVGRFRLQEIENENLRKKQKLNSTDSLPTLPCVKGLDSVAQESEPTLIVNTEVEAIEADSWDVLWEHLQQGDDALIAALPDFIPPFSQMMTLASIDISL